MQSARPISVANTLSPNVAASQTLRQSRYSPTADDFTADNRSASQSFMSPARAAASFIPRAYNSASRYSLLGNLNRRNRSVSQNEAEHIGHGEERDNQN